MLDGINAANQSEQEWQVDKGMEGQADQNYCKVEAQGFEGLESCLGDNSGQNAENPERSAPDYEESQLHHGFESRLKKIGHLGLWLFLEPGDEIPEQNGKENDRKHISACHGAEGIFWNDMQEQIAYSLFCSGNLNRGGCQADFCACSRLQEGNK